MYLNESKDMIYVACTHYDMEMQNGKLGTDRVYEGSYEQAFDTVVDELEKREKVIDEMSKNIGFINEEIIALYGSVSPERSFEQLVKEYFYRKVKKDE